MPHITPGWHPLKVQVPVIFGFFNWFLEEILNLFTPKAERQMRTSRGTVTQINDKGAITTGAITQINDKVLKMKQQTSKQ